jgi:hypothetical protein
MRNSLSPATPGGEVQLSHGEEWQTPLATSYRCSSQQLNLTTEVGNIAAALQLTGLQEEAYRTVHGKGFSAGQYFHLIVIIISLLMFPLLGTGFLHSDFLNTREIELLVQDIDTH